MENFSIKLQNYDDWTDFESLTNRTSCQNYGRKEITLLIFLRLFGQLCAG